MELEDLRTEHKRRKVRRTKHVLLNIFRALLLINGAYLHGNQDSGLCPAIGLDIFMALFVDFQVTNLSPVIGGDWEEQRFVSTT